MVDRVEIDLSLIFQVSNRRPIQYGVMLELSGGGSLTLYNGKRGVKSVIGGRLTTAEQEALEAFVAEHIDNAAAPSSPSPASTDAVGSAPKPTGRAIKPLLNLLGTASAWIGSDEAGKGDYFGPLVVAAVAVTPDQLEALAAAGVRDSKEVGNREAMRLSGWIPANYPTESLVVMPTEYNRVYGGNLNVLLAKLHARVLAKLAARTCIAECLTDQFARPQALLHELRALDYQGRIVTRTKAESDGAVAAASIVARGLYLEALGGISTEYTVALSPGAGPQVLDQGRELVRLFGEDVLARVGKWHFKTTTDILGG